MDIKALLKIFEWMLYAMLVCAALVAATLVTLILAILSWTS